MSRKIILIVILILLPLALNDKATEEYMYQKYTKFNIKYNKHYSSNKEMINKFEIFKENYLEMLNQRLSNGNSTVLGITQFMDIPSKEFTKQYLSVNTTDGKNNNSIRNVEQRLLNSSTDDIIIPESFDWRDKGIVSKVLNQGDCGACWAFSALVVVEGIYAMKYGRLYNISPQQIIDCNGSGFTCTFGQIMGAMTYLKSFKGIPIDQYPLEGQKKECQYESIHIEKGFAKVEEYHRLFDVDENELKKIVYTMGPVAVNINAGFFQFYKGGIMDPNDCVPFVNHGVAIVGYGIENLVPYWIIKNSWGESWGEQGYLRLIRGKGQCGINTTVVTAVIQ